MANERRTILVTGATGGIGQEIVRAFALEGAKKDSEFRNCNIILADLDGAKRAAEELMRCNNSDKLTRSRMIFLSLDVTDFFEVSEAIKNAAAEYGKIDILVNNAGIMPTAAMGPLPRIKLDDFATLDLLHDVMEVNFWGAFYMCHQVLPLMQSAGYGRIVNLSSIAAHTGEEKNHIYAASKAAVEALTLALASKEAQFKKGDPGGAHDITVNAVAPGIADTAMTRYLDDERARAFMDLYLERMPLHRKIRPEEIANAVLFLSRNESAAINGHIMMVDGGYVKSR